MGVDDDSDPLSQWWTEIASPFPFKSFHGRAESSEVDFGGGGVHHSIRLPAFWLKATFLSINICEHWFYKRWVVRSDWITVIHHTVVTIIRPVWATGFHSFFNSFAYSFHNEWMYIFCTCYISGTVWGARMASVKKTDPHVLTGLTIQQALEMWKKHNVGSNFLVFGELYKVLSEQAVVSSFAIILNAMCINIHIFSSRSFFNHLYESLIIWTIYSWPQLQGNDLYLLCRQYPGTQ